MYNIHVVTATHTSYPMDYVAEGLTIKKLTVYNIKIDD